MVKIIERLITSLNDYKNMLHKELKELDKNIIGKSYYRKYKKIHAEIVELNNLEMKLEKELNIRKKELIKWKQNKN